MPTKKTKPTSASSRTLSRLQGSMKRLQKDAEALLRRTQKQATSLISKDQRRAVDRLLGQATRLRDDLEKRAERATKDLEARAERFLATLEKEAAKRVEPLLRRLDLPSRHEVQTLARRLNQLESRLAARQLGMVQNGIARVQLEPLSVAPEPQPIPIALGAWPSYLGSTRALSH